MAAVAAAFAAFAAQGIALLACSHAKVQYADGGIAPRVYEKAGFYRRVDALRAADSMQFYLGATSAWHRDIHLKYGPVQYPDCMEDSVCGFRPALEGRIAIIDQELVISMLSSGLTNTARIAENDAQICTRRQKELSREVSILSQRRIDARTYGLPEGHPILRASRRP